MPNNYKSLFSVPVCFV